MFFWCLRFNQPTNNFFKDFFPSLQKRGWIENYKDTLLIVQLGFFFKFYLFLVVFWWQQRHDINWPLEVIQACNIQKTCTIGIIQQPNLRHALHILNATISKAIYYIREQIHELTFEWLWNKLMGEIYPCTKVSDVVSRYGDNFGILSKNSYWNSDQNSFMKTSQLHIFSLFIALAISRYGDDFGILSNVHSVLCQNFHQGNHQRFVPSIGKKK